MSKCARGEAMSGSTPKQIQNEATQAEIVSADGIDRRGFLNCMAWAGTGLVWTFAGGDVTRIRRGDEAFGAVRLHIRTDQR